MAQPGPAQVFNSNISRVNWPLGGDLLFMRVKNRHVGGAPAGSPVSDISQMPGKLKSFNTLATITPQKDPDKAGNAPAITDPATPGMLGYYALWPRAPIKTVSKTTTTTPVGGIAIIDTAAWQSYNGSSPAFQTPIMTMEEAFEWSFNAWNQAPPTGVQAKRGDWSVSLAEVFDITINRFRQVKSYPDPEWAATFAFNGWTWHLDPGTPTSTVQTDTTSVFILNLGILQKNMATDPITKKKPPKLTIRIFPPAKSTTGTNYWGFTAAATRLRKAFPIGDVGDELLMPTWTPYPYPVDAKIGGGVHDAPNGGNVDIEITFGTKTVPPSVKLIDNLTSVPIT